MTQSFAQKTVVVTGAAGFIGSQLAEDLVRRGARVRAFVRYKSDGTAGWLDQSPLRDQMDVVAGDIVDQGSVRSALNGCDYVFHLAALIAIPYSYVAPLSYQRVNVEGTLNVLQAARDLGVGRIVHTSTSETYGTARYVPIDENHPLQAQSPYSASKIGADKMVESFHASFGTPVVTVRPFNTYGPRQSGRAVIPTIITQCLAGQQVKLGNLSPTRDFVFVSDTVDGFCRAALAPGAEGLTINLGTGHEVSIGDLAHLIAELTDNAAGVHTETERVRPDKSEVHRLLANADLAYAKLGWKSVVGLGDGLRRTIEWISANQNKFRTGEYVL
jgi:NAD dependent epimerase/dehydratase